jgi:uncharacterized protein YkwD
MVNRSLVLVFGAIVLTSVAVGGLVGMQFGGSGDGADRQGTEANATATPTPDDGSDDSTPTPDEPTPTATPTPDGGSDESTPAPLSESVDRSAVEAELLASINGDVRTGRDSLVREDTLDEMARFHSENMESQGYPSHDAAGYSTKARYEKFEKYSSCRIPSDGGRSVRTGEEIEVIGRLTVDDSDVDESALADRLVEKWLDDAGATEKLRYSNAAEVGIGVVVSDRGGVYATVDLC